MVRIKNLGFFDVFRLKEMVPFVEEDEASLYIKSWAGLACSFLQKILPLRMRRFADSYVAVDDGKLLGMVSLRPQKGNPMKWKIIKLFLNENAYDAGRLLIDFVTAKYGAQGVKTFFTKVDSEHKELIDLFAKGSGYRLCSSEELWRISSDIELENIDKQMFIRPFKNSDAQQINEFYSESIMPHFRPSLAKAPAEFKDPIIAFSKNSLTFKFVVEDPQYKRLSGYFAIMTENDKDFVLDIVLSSAHQDKLFDIIDFSVRQISKRTKDFNLFFLNRKYLYSNDFYTEFLNEHKFQVAQNRVVLVKDFFRQVKEYATEQKSPIVFSNISTKPAFKLMKYD